MMFLMNVKLKKQAHFPTEKMHFQNNDVWWIQGYCSNVLKTGNMYFFNVMNRNTIVEARSIISTVF